MQQPAVIRSFHKEGARLRPGRPRPASCPGCCRRSGPTTNARHEGRRVGEARTRERALRWSADPAQGHAGVADRRCCASPAHSAGRARSPASTRRTWSAPARSGRTCASRLQLSEGGPRGRRPSWASSPPRTPRAAPPESPRATTCKEVRFYQELVRTVEIRTPRCHFAAFDPGHLGLRADDGRPGSGAAGRPGGGVQRGRSGPRPGGAGPKLHAPRWGDPAARRARLDRATDPGGRQRCSRWSTRASGRASSRATPERLEPEAVALAETPGPGRGRLADGGRGPHRRDPRRLPPRQHALRHRRGRLPAGGGGLADAGRRASPSPMPPTSWGPGCPVEERRAARGGAASRVPPRPPRRAARGRLRRGSSCWQRLPASSPSAAW